MSDRTTDTTSESGTTTERSRSESESLRTREKSASRYRGDREFTDRTHKAGGFLLMLAGIIGVIVGLVGLISAVTGTAIPLVDFSPVVTGLGSAVVVVFALIEFGGGVAAYRGKNWYGSMTAAILGMVTLFTLPLDLIGTILIALGEGGFERK